MNIHIIYICYILDAHSFGVDDTMMSIIVNKIQSISNDSSCVRLNKEWSLFARIMYINISQSFIFV